MLDCRGVDTTNANAEALMSEDLEKLHPILSFFDENHRSAKRPVQSVPAAGPKETIALPPLHVCSWILAEADSGIKSAKLDKNDPKADVMGFWVLAASKAIHKDNHEWI